MMVQTKLREKPVITPLRRVDKPFYGLKSYKADVARPVRAVKKKSGNAARFTPWKVITATMFIGIAGFLYLTHVFTTQGILNEVNDLRREHEAASRSYAEYSLQYDRMTGPAEIYDKARTMGFIHSGATDPVIRVNR